VFLVIDIGSSSSKAVINTGAGTQGHEKAVLAAYALETASKLR
jgi:sugar (pentulose or hexulose) kinase